MMSINDTIGCVNHDCAKCKAVQEPVAMEAVYETIIHWDKGGGKRSRRELARRIVGLYTTQPAAPTASTQELTKQEFGGDCDTPPEPWSAIWVAWNSEDGFTFWATEKQAALWSAADSNEWPVQYAMQKV